MVNKCLTCKALPSSERIAGHWYASCKCVDSLTYGRDPAESVARWSNQFARANTLAELLDQLIPARSQLVGPADC